MYLLAGTPGHALSFLSLLSRQKPPHSQQKLGFLTTQVPFVILADCLSRNGLPLLSKICSSQKTSSVRRLGGGPVQMHTTCQTAVTLPVIGVVCTAAPPTPTPLYHTVTDGHSPRP